MSETIQINFGRPAPLFPLPGAVLLPHAVQPLHIFEKRYRQMVNDCLDGAGQIAMASFAGHGRGEAGQPAVLRQAVCVGQIIHHVPHRDGRHDILLQGICRARIIRVIEPEGDRLYRTAMLRPLEKLDEDPPRMPRERRQLRSLLRGPELKRMRGVDKLMEWFDHEGVPTHALLELIGFSLLSDGELRYRLLAEASPHQRAAIIREELLDLARLIRAADQQPFRDWPKHLSWN
jgi:hypothetical protein